MSKQANLLAHLRCYNFADVVSPLPPASLLAAGGVGVGLDVVDAEDSLSLRMSGAVASAEAIEAHSVIIATAGWSFVPPPNHGCHSINGETGVLGPVVNL